MMDAHRFLAVYPTFQKTLELWSYKRHWAPNEHELRKKSVQQDKKEQQLLTHTLVRDLTSLYSRTLHFERQTSLICLLQSRRSITTSTPLSH